MCSENYSRLTIDHQKSTNRIMEMYLGFLAMGVLYIDNIITTLEHYGDVDLGEDDD